MPKQSSSAFRRILYAGALILTFAVCPSAQNPTTAPQTRQYVVVLKRGANWLPGKTAAQQPLADHGRYLNEQMSKGTLQIAGPFLDDSGGLIILNGKDESEVRAIEEQDPGVMKGILEIDFIRPFRLSFDAATGKTPFKKAN